MFTEFFFYDFSVTNNFLNLFHLKLLSFSEEIELINSKGNINLEFFSLRHLNARLMDSEFEGAREDMTLEEIKEILCRRFEVLDYESAKADVRPFIGSDAPLAVWSSDFFRSITGDLTEQTRNDRAHER